MPRSSPPPADPPADPLAGLGEARAAALDAALTFLAPARRTCLEVRRHLAKKGFAEEAVARTEERLLELGLLDDAALAAAWVELAVVGRHEGRARAEAALAARGVEASVIATALAALAGMEEGDGELDRAIAAGSARMRAMSGPPAALRRRLWSYLARRGFDADTVEQACNRLLDPASTPDDSEEQAGESRVWGVRVR
ncbi:MAG TPA: RecX family transcriptional regulator [Actinomycetota bacterium]|nr:RecX family transcriptional regulator [Actinomycetota bacterium]